MHMLSIGRPGLCIFASGRGGGTTSVANWQAGHVCWYEGCIHARGRFTDEGDGRLPHDPVISIVKIMWTVGTLALQPNGAYANSIQGKGRGRGKVPPGAKGMTVHMFDSKVLESQ